MNYLKNKKKPMNKTEIIWEGVVVDILDNVFVAHLKDIIGNSLDEIVEIKIESIDKPEEIVLGGIFYWIIGDNFSSIVFQKIHWTREQIDGTIEEAKRLYKQFCDKKDSIA